MVRLGYQKEILVSMLASFFSLGIHYPQVSALGPPGMILEGKPTQPGSSSFALLKLRARTRTES